MLRHLEALGVDTMNQLYPVYAIVVGLAVMFAGIIYIFKDNIKKDFDKFKQAKEIQQMQNLDMVLPHAVFRKSWRTEGGNILGELHLEASAKTGQEAMQNLNALIIMSMNHDKSITKNQKEENSNAVG